MSIEDQDTAAFLAVASLEMAIEDTTGPTSLSFATSLLHRGWTPQDLRVLAWLAEHAIITGSPMGAEDEDFTGDSAARLRALTTQCLTMLEYHDRLFGKAIAFDWMAVIMSAPAHALTEIADQFDRTGTTTVYHETTALLGALGPIAWAAGIPLEEALALTDTPATRERLTFLAEARGFALPPRRRN